MRRWVIAGIGSVVITTAVGGAIAFASSDSEGGATGRQADRAIHAALQATRGGTANAVERLGERRVLGSGGQEAQRSHRGTSD